MTVWINVVVRAKLYAHLFEAIQNVYEMQGDYSEISMCACMLRIDKRKKKEEEEERDDEKTRRRQLMSTNISLTR